MVCVDSRDAVPGVCAAQTEICGLRESLRVLDASGVVCRLPVPDLTERRTEQGTDTSTHSSVCCGLLLAYAVLDINMIKLCTCCTQSTPCLLSLIDSLECFIQSKLL